MQRGWATDDVARGEALYKQTCVACHGASGAGSLPGVPDLTKASGSLAKPDDALFKNIKEGFQSPGSALAMPPKGGNPALTDEDIRIVIQYMRSAFMR
ncbi:MAG: cytochrome c [Gammaproteobacteria bacterium]|nr:cytochrome c [Gammaproteobacteria bacterium]